MTPLEGNKLIAEFMGRTMFPDGKHYHGMQTPEDLTYHEDWRLLMPVVEKINKLSIDNYGEMGVYISPGKCQIGENEHDTIKSLESYHCTLLNLVWETIVQFIQWYNSLTK